MKKKKLLTDKSGSLYEQQISEAVQTLADDIDFEVLSSVMINSGWSKVVLNPMTWEQGAEVDFWIHKHVKGGHMDRGLVFVFEDPKEANWFKLRWLS